MPRSTVPCRDLGHGDIPVLVAPSCLGSSWGLCPCVPEVQGPRGQVTPSLGWLAAGGLLQALVITHARPLPCLASCGGSWKFG